MSGGVDSSVSAALLKKAGYDVTGVFIKVWSPDWLPCRWKEERRDAMRVAACLGISFLTFDFEKEYKAGVVDYMLQEYTKGRTPNPDVMCNKEIKFGYFLKKSLALGADFIATGHYAITDSNKLFEGADKLKDQSYFLWTLNQEALKHVLFPVGGYEKSEVRKLAEKFGLPTAKKKDSQGICFIGEVDLKEFLSHYIVSKHGNILNEAGEKIGEHDGVIFYTIGQRHGFSISKKNPKDTPYYIVGKNPADNTLTVSHKTTGNNELKDVRSVRLINVNWLSGAPDPEKVYGARLRYRQEKQMIKIQTLKNVTVATFGFLQGCVAVGQSLVLYDSEECLGGGVIDEVL